MSARRIMICPKCHFTQADGGKECIRCGIIFAKFKPAEHYASGVPGLERPFAGRRDTGSSGAFDRVRDLLFGVAPGENPFYVAGRVLLYLGLILWGWKFMTASIGSNYVGQSFMHSINIPFHEAGHIIFSPLGRFMGVLGGTLGQIIIPCLCLGAFLFKNHDPFGASVALWWIGQNFMDIAPYINDARALELILIGGVTGKEVDGYHDWQNLLGTLGWLEHDHAIALASYRFGTLLMVLAIAWGGYVLYLQYKHRNDVEP